jgi:hypothetical protein
MLLLISAFFESRIPRLPQRFVSFFFSLDKNQRKSPLDLSSFNRSGFEPPPSSSSSTSSQVPHHTIRTSVRENPKSASLSAQQQQQQIPKIQEKLKCVSIFSVVTNIISLLSLV